MTFGGVWLLLLEQVLEGWPLCFILQRTVFQVYQGQRRAWCWWCVQPAMDAEPCLYLGQGAQVHGPLTRSIWQLEYWGRMSRGAC